MSKAELHAMIHGQRSMREVLLRDRLRPLWHLVAPEGPAVPFDPNGAIFWNGRYHLGYIFQDAKQQHCWAHVSSLDLVHWRWHEPWLVPAAGDVDRGIFSGNCFVNRQGEATMLYHGVDAGNCIATCADPDLEGWTKLASNPIVPNPAPGSAEAQIYNSWDPHGWVEKGRYYAVFGGNPSTCVPPALFRGDTLDKWSYVGPFMSHDMPDVASHEDVSCPDFFELGGRHVLVCISHSCGARYYVGTWQNEQFHPQLHRRMNWPGGTCFAPETLLDAKGRRILWTWALESPASDSAAPWSGTMTLPRVLSLAPDHTLLIDPVEELQSLRTRARTLQNIHVTPGSDVRLANVRGDSFELNFTIDPGDARRVGIKVRCAPDGSEETAMWFDAAAGTITIDTEKSTLDRTRLCRQFVMKGGENPVVTSQVAPFKLDAGETLNLRIFLDRSILEVFANRRQCVTQRLYPTRADSLDVVLAAQGGAWRATQIDAWDMAPANPW